MSDDGAVNATPSILALHEERLHVGKRLRKTLVRVVRRTFQRFVAVEETLTHDQVVVTHVPIGRVVETVPPIREEDGTTILPIVEEQLVLVRRLVLTEEVHVRRIRTTTQHVETVALRRQEATVTRTELTPSDTSVPTDSPTYEDHHE